MPGKETVFIQRLNENFYTYIIKIFFQKRKFFEGIYKKITNKEIFDNKQRLCVKLEYDKNRRAILIIVLIVFSFFNIICFLPFIVINGILCACIITEFYDKGLKEDKKE